MDFERLKGRPAQAKSKTPAYDPQGFRDLATYPNRFQEVVAPVVGGSEPKLLERGPSDLILFLSNAFAHRHTWLNSRGQPGGLITPVSFFGSLTERSFNEVQLDKWREYLDRGDIPRDDAVKASGFLITSRLPHLSNGELSLQVADALIPDLNTVEQSTFNQPPIVVFRVLNNGGIEK